MQSLKLEKNNNTGLLDVNEAADFLKVPKSAIYGFTMRKEIKHSKIGNRLRFRQRDLDIFVNQNSVEAGEFD